MEVDVDKEFEEKSESFCTARFVRLFTPEGVISSRLKKTNNRSLLLRYDHYYM